MAMRLDTREGLIGLYEAAVLAAHPDGCLIEHLPELPRNGRLIVLGAGKAAAAMARTGERYYSEHGGLERVVGCLTPPHGYAATLRALETGARQGGAWKPAKLELLEGRHPMPDAASAIAAERALALAAGATADDVVLVLLSGGASALWAAPAGFNLATKTALTRGLLKSGADIHQMNTVRRHLSRIKGGRLAQAARAAGQIVTLAISDVPGDDPATIGSGPTWPDATTLCDARAVIETLGPRMRALGLDVPAAVAEALVDPANETAKPGDAAFARSRYEIIATPKVALARAGELAAQAGYKVIDLGDAVTGEARVVARAHADMAIAAKARGERVAIISGGELEVTVRNRDGRGGRSQEYALALAIAIDGSDGICGLAADSDGIDGGEGLVSDPAGAVVSSATVGEGRARHIDATSALDNNDATPYFARLDGLLVRGPTHTNVNDFRVILVDPAPTTRAT